MTSTLAKACQFLKRQGRALAECKFPIVWVVTDTKRMANPEKIVRSLPRGTGVILRHYDVPKRSGLAQRLATLCRARGLKFLVGGDWRLAARVGADGVHLSDDAARSGLAAGGRLWRRGKASRLLTVSAHGARGLQRGAELRASAALLGPVFRTASHPRRAPLGNLRMALMIRAARLPVLALGGVTTANIKKLHGAGIAGIAGIGFASL